jgi:hypothetical protein
VRRKTWKFAIAVALAGALSAFGFMPAAIASRPTPFPPPTQPGASIAVTVPSLFVISTCGSEVVLQRRPGNGNTTRYEGVLPCVQVTDTRSPRPGWNVEISLEAPSSIDTSSARLFVHPNQPEVISGDSRGVWKGQPGWRDFGTQISLFDADQGAGGGTYREDATIALVVPRSDAQTITLGFGVSAF